MELIEKAKRLEEELLKLSRGFINSENLGIVKLVSDTVNKFNLLITTIPDNLNDREKLEHLTRYCNYIDSDEITKYCDSLSLKSMLITVHDWLSNYPSLRDKPTYKLESMGYFDANQHPINTGWKYHLEEVSKRRLFLFEVGESWDDDRLTKFYQENENDIGKLLGIGFQLEVLFHSFWSKGVDTEVRNITNNEDINRGYDRCFVFLINPYIDDSEEKEPKGCNY